MGGVFPWGGGEGTGRGKWFGPKGGKSRSGDRRPTGTGEGNLSTSNGEREREEKVVVDTEG